MRWLKIWGTPFAAMGLWMVLAYNDWHMGTVVFSRATFDQFLTIYTSLLGVEAHELPGLLAKGIVLDGSLIAAFIAYRKRAVLIPWLQRHFAPIKARFAK